MRKQSAFDSSPPSHNGGLEVGVCRVVHACAGVYASDAKIPFVRIKPMHEYRLRQLALVTDDLDKISGQLSGAFGLRVGFRDPSVAEFGLINALFPVGGDFVEILQPVKHDASAKRYRERRGGDTGYMVILQTGEALQHRARLSAMGVRSIYTLERHGYLTTQFHPKEFGGILASIDHMEVPDWKIAESDWEPAGPDWRAARGSECLGFAAVTLQSADPAAMAARWAELLQLPAPTTPPVLPLLGADIRFVADADGSGAAMTGIDIRMRNPSAVLERAKSLGLPVRDGAVAICGVQMRPVEG